MTRKLTLKKESLAELRTDELTSVVAAAGTHGVTCTPTGITVCEACTVTTVINRPAIGTIDSPCGTR